MDKIQNTSPGFRCDVREPHAHAGTEGILIGLGTDPGDHAFGRQPFSGRIRQGKLDDQLRADRQRRFAFNKKPSSSDSACAAFYVHTLRGVVSDAYREGNPRLRSAIFQLAGLPVGQDMINDEIPGEGAERLSVDSDERNDFSGTVQMKRFALMPGTRHYRKFHVALFMKERVLLSVV